VACAKHFVGDGGTTRGINENNTVASYNELYHVHMRPYLDALAKGVSTIMASYSSWNGVKMHASHYLLTRILKNRMGFKVNAETHGKCYFNVLSAFDCFKREK